MSVQQTDAEFNSLLREMKESFFAVVEENDHLERTKLAVAHIGVMNKIINSLKGNYEQIADSLNQG